MRDSDVQREIDNMTKYKEHRVGEYIPMPEQEPVAKFYVEHRTNACSEVCDEKGKVYATCDWTTEASKRAQLICDLLNTTPPQRTWVGLTDEEIDAIYEQHHNQYGECESANLGYERAIEAKLKEKNT